MSTIGNPPKRKSHFRISLRALIILVLVAGGWMGWLVRKRRIQRAAVASIQQADGYVAKVTAAGFAHLKMANQLEELNLAGTRLTDDELVHLQGMASLKFLGLGGTGVTDVGADKLQQALPNLAIRR